VWLFANVCVAVTRKWYQAYVFCLKFLVLSSCRFGCVYLEIFWLKEAGGKRLKIKKKGWPRVFSAHLQPVISDERQKEDMEAEETACNANPHRRDLSKERRIPPLQSAYDATVMSNILTGELIKKLSKISLKAHRRLDRLKKQLEEEKEAAEA